MSVGLTLNNNILGLSYDGKDYSFSEVGDGVIAPPAHLISLVLGDDSQLIGTHRIPIMDTKNPLARLWRGRCTIYEYKDEIDPKTFQTIQTEVKTLVNEPCRLSYNREQSTNIQNGAAVVSQSITLFIRPDLVINPGSVIEVTQHGVTEKYKGSGQPAVYCNHQEIVLKLYEDEA